MNPLPHDSFWLLAYVLSWLITGILATTAWFILFMETPFYYLAWVFSLLQLFMALFWVVFGLYSTLHNYGTGGGSQKMPSAHGPDKNEME